MKEVQRGVCAPQGFTATGISAGLRKNPGKKDLALIYSEVPCTAAGVTTQNITCAAPVKVTRKHLENGTAQAIVCNAGNANACTVNGMEVAEGMCQVVSKALNIPAESVLVGSTGVIGVSMDLKPIANHAEELVDSLNDRGSNDCAHAIMTTDLVKKEIALTFEIDGKWVTIGGISKGSGMIHPNMATMLGFVTTDVAISPAMLQQAVSDAVNLSFNMISVDGDTSTNDMALVLANGLAKNDEITEKNQAYALFYEALLQVFTHLAVAIAADGEGASKLLVCHVTGGTTLAESQIVAKSVIQSSLFKAAMFGEDANWGRVLCAMGNSGIDFDVNAVSVEFRSTAGAVTVCKNGMGIFFDESLASQVLAEHEIAIHIVIGSSVTQATAWGCDLTYDYVKINGDYRS